MLENHKARLQGEDVDDVPDVELDTKSDDEDEETKKRKLLESKKDDLDAYDARQA
jgi:hypothetical protein